MFRNILFNLKSILRHEILFRIVSNHMTETMADRRLPSTDSVLTMLKWVEKYMDTRCNKVQK